MDDHRYDDILSMPHPVSARRTHLTNWQRAAQFAPFAALTGFDDEINETARMTDRQIELDDDALLDLDEKLRILSECSREHPELTITYFQPDGKKAGGKYATVTGKMKKLRLMERELILTDGTSIPLDAILHLDGACFSALE